jgi:tetratricopeptide (TPR) repeat protein
MVHVARNDLDAAVETLQKGAPFQDRLEGGGERYPAKGLYWLLGLTRLARGEPAEAHVEFDRELATGGKGLYAAEFATNACDGHGFALLSTGDADGAEAMFTRALEAYPDHLRSLFGLADACRRRGLTKETDAVIERGAKTVEALRSGGRAVEAEMAAAFWHMACGRQVEAIAALHQMLIAAPPGFAGWTIPVEPFFMSLHADPAFQAVLQRLAERAI